MDSMAPTVIERLLVVVRKNTHASTIFVPNSERSIRGDSSTILARGFHPNPL